MIHKMEYEKKFRMCPRFNARYKFDCPCCDNTVNVGEEAAYSVIEPEIVICGECANEEEGK
jgi:hypothetical protein